MRKRRIIVLMTIGTMLSLAGCKVSPERALTESATTTVEAPKTENSVTETVTVSQGEIWNAKLKARRPVAVMLDNHSGARPQAGLKDAELVIEALAEGNITRYMAFFFEGMPQSVGPIRSARPYFIDRAMELGAVYVHVGGSPKALSDIKQLKVNDLDGLSSSNKVFFRKSHKKMPHNLYSSLEILRNETEKRAFAQEPTVTKQVYALEDTIPAGESAQYVSLPYRKNDGGYVVSYSYDTDAKTYQRFVNQKAHADEIDQTPLSAKNILIQYVPTKVVDDVGRLDLDLVGSGSGWWLTNGVKVEIKWEKTSRKGETKYMQMDGQELLLNPGNIWIQIVPKSMTIQWEKI